MTNFVGPHGWLAVVTLLCVVIVCPPARSAGSPATDALDHAAELRDSGDFKGAAQALTQALPGPGVSPAERRQLEFQRDVLNRIKHDYSLTREELFRKLAASLKNATRQEFERWLAAGWFDGRSIDGQTYYLDVSISNLYFRHPELKSRRMDGKDDTPEQRGGWKCAVASKRPRAMKASRTCCRTLFFAR